jgi:hypothetical protein
MLRLPLRTIDDDGPESTRASLEKSTGYLASQRIKVL